MDAVQLSGQREYQADECGAGVGAQYDPLGADRFGHPRARNLEQYVAVEERAQDVSLLGLVPVELVLADHWQSERVSRRHRRWVDCVEVGRVRRSLSGPC